MNMAVHLYSKRSLLADYLRSVVGLVFAVVGLYALGESALIAQAAMVVVGGIFALYGLRAVTQSFTKIEIDAESVVCRGLMSTRLRWQDMRRMTLRHYSVKREKSAGWMELNISDGRSAPWHGIRVDSGLIDFQAVATQAASAAASNGVPFDGPSAENLAALGISVASEASSPVRDRPLLRQNGR